MHHNVVAVALSRLMDIGKRKNDRAALPGLTCAQIPATVDDAGFVDFFEVRLELVFVEDECAELVVGTETDLENRQGRVRGNRQAVFPAGLEPPGAVKFLVGENDCCQSSQTLTLSPIQQGETPTGIADGSELGRAGHHFVGPVGQPAPSQPADHSGLDLSGL